MNSSISSFRVELRVIACVLAFLGLVEVAMRGLEDRLSIDIAHIRAGGEIADRIGRDGKPGVLLLGNSLTRDGIKPAVVERAAGPEARVEAYHPDGSSVIEWAFAYRKYFLHPGKSPDFLIVGAGRSHLFDSEPRSERFGAYFCGRRDLAGYFRRHVRDLDDAAGFILARASVAYANRERVQPRLLSMLVPHYQETLRLLATRRPAADGAPQALPGHHYLAELLEDARAGGTRVAVVAIPMPDPYPLPEETRRVIEEAGAKLIDARELEGIHPGNFPDGYHLDDAGAELLTRHVIDGLGPGWWEHRDGFR